MKGAMKNNMKTNNKKAISLIVLVITIIVMIILAGAIIIALENSGIIEKAEDTVDETNLKEVQTLAQLKWAEVYLDYIEGDVDDLEGEVLKRLGDELGDHLSLYKVTVTEQGVDVALNDGSATESWVVATVDGVPIPKGFVASSATGENTKNGGLVIYEGTEAVTDANVEDAKRTRNQYVWIPIPKDDFTTKFVRGAYNKSTYSNVLGTDRWEVVLDTTTNMPLTTQDTNYVSATTLAEVQAMYESVKEYEGFYIARYEAGIDTQRTSNTTLVKGSSVYSMMGKIPYDHIPWGTSMSDDKGGAVEVARSIYPKTKTAYGVVSTLTYGVQWDRILAWWLERGAVTSVSYGKGYGNFLDYTIAEGALNDGALYAVVASETSSYQEATSSTTKKAGTRWLLSTGALKVASVNNIFDMAGNLYEMTMEGIGESSHLYRGGSFANEGRDYGPESGVGTSASNESEICGFRVALYIKK